MVTLLKLVNELPHPIVGQNGHTPGGGNLFHRQPLANIGPAHSHLGEKRLPKKYLEHNIMKYYLCK